MKKVVVVLVLVSGLGMTPARAQEEQVASLQAENPKEQGVVGRIIDDLKESTRTVHEINKENVAAERDAFKARHANATEPDPDFVTFREAKGFFNKMNVAFTNIGKSSRENSKKEKERREQIKSHESYRNLLEEQRESREANF